MTLLKSNPNWRHVFVLKMAYIYSEWTSQWCINSHKHHLQCPKREQLHVWRVSNIMQGSFKVISPWILKLKYLGDVYLSFSALCHSKLDSLVHNVHLEWLTSVHLSLKVRRRTVYFLSFFRLCGQSKGDIAFTRGVCPCVSASFFIFFPFYN